jgi:hypothetical protein
MRSLRGGADSGLAFLGEERGERWVGIRLSNKLLNSLTRRGQLRGQ